jgi:hypothetical protein
MNYLLVLKDKNYIGYFYMITNISFKYFNKFHVMFFNILYQCNQISF